MRQLALAFKGIVDLVFAGLKSAKDKAVAGGAKDRTVHQRAIFVDRHMQRRAAERNRRADCAVLRRCVGRIRHAVADVRIHRRALRRLRRFLHAHGHHAVMRQLALAVEHVIDLVFARRKTAEGKRFAAGDRLCADHFPRIRAVDRDVQRLRSAERNRRADCAVLRRCVGRLRHAVADVRIHLRGRRLRLRHIRLHCDKIIARQFALAFKGIVNLVFAALKSAKDKAVAGGTKRCAVHQRAVPVDRHMQRRAAERHRRAHSAVLRAGFAFTGHRIRRFLHRRRSIPGHAESAKAAALARGVLSREARVLLRLGRRGGRRLRRRRGRRFGRRRGRRLGRRRGRRLRRRRGRRLGRRLGRRRGRQFGRRRFPDEIIVKSAGAALRARTAPSLCKCGSGLRVKHRHAQHGGHHSFHCVSIHIFPLRRYQSEALYHLTIFHANMQPLRGA